MRAALAALLLCASLRAAPPAPAAAFESDPRVELLAVVHMLAEPAAFARRAPSAYTRRAGEAFAPYAGHRAVASLRGLLKNGDRLAAARALLSCSAPPELVEDPAVDEDSSPRSSEEKAFLRDLRDFASRSRFMDFYRENAQLYEDLAVQARAEAGRGLRPEAVSSYLRRDAAARQAFLISGLLAWDLAANARGVRIRPALEGKSMFGLDDLGTGAAHAAAHDILSPLARKHREELESYAGLMPAGCTSTWMGCVMEHVDLAVTLRALAAERGEGEYASRLAQYKGFPFLEALGLRLKEWEARTGASFEEFYPRLVAVFREALLKDAAAQARAALARRAAPPPDTSAETPSAGRVNGGVSDPRLELAGALIGLAERSEPSGPFAAFSGHPAVEKVRRLAGKIDQRALPAQLMLYVSAPPALELLGPVPANYTALAGGEEDLKGFYAAVRDFAVRSDFSGYYRGRAKEYEALAQRHSARLKALSPSAGRFVISALLPKRYWVRLVRIPRASASEVWTFMSADLLDETGAPRPSASVEIVMKVDPRVELLSVLHLLGRGPGAKAGPASAYRQDAERWFAGFSTHPAVAQTASLLGRDRRVNLPAELILRLSEPPDLYAQDPIPGGYLDAAGGEEAVDRFIEALGAFARASRFMDFYAAHREDHEAFAVRAESEALASISPKAVQAYVGSALSARYYFPLAPLLAEEHAANFSLQHHDHVEEVRLRPGRYSAEQGHQFLLNHFGSSPAHELVHTVTNPLVAGFDAKGAKAPAGCNDQRGGSWSGCIEEHLVYAVTLRILAQELGEAHYVEMVDRYMLRGFPYLKLLGERLKEYEGDRGRYKTLKDFYPRLEPVFVESLPKEAPAEPSPWDPKTRQLKDEGVKDFMAGRFLDAAKKFESALEIAPRDAEAALNLGVVHEKLERPDKALESYGNAVAFSASGAARDRDIQVAALSSRATLLRAMGRAEQARQDLMLVLKIAPYDWEGREEIEKRLAHER
jgi:tetratricopeptide (TPR) repeat protein